MDTINAGRLLIGDSLGFHIIIVSLSIGLPFLMSIFEWYAWKKNSENIRALVRLIARWTAVFVIGGVMSGTIIALQFSTLWAPFLNEVRPTVGVFFQLEGYMFFIEAAFLSWYLLTIDKVGTLRHLLIGIPISVGTIGSAFFITVVNAWMNNPSAVITSTTWNEVFHSVVSYLFATSFLVLGYAAWRKLRANKQSSHFLNWTIGRLAVISAVLLFLLAILGHQSAVDIARTQPNKLASIELLDKTMTNAPIRIGGEIDDSGNASGGIVIPGMLSILAGNSIDHQVQGLSETPRDKWPPLIVHALFDIKMILVGVSSILIVGSIFFYFRTKRLPNWLLGMLAISGTIGLVMIELGWMITEIGRQPYAVYGKLLTRDAFTKNSDLLATGYIFPVLFVVLTIATLFALNETTKQWRRVEKTSW